MDTPFTMVLFETLVARKLLSRCRRLAEVQHNAASTSRRALSAFQRDTPVVDRGPVFYGTERILQQQIVDHEDAAKMYGQVSAQLEQALKE